jgi:putative ABC transport system substrate-binding protein
MPPLNPAFWRAMRELGYSEGENILTEYRWAEGNPERLPGLLTELTRRKPDVIFAEGVQAAVAVRNAEVAIPVIFLTHADPVEAGFVSSLGKPGGMLSGVTMIAPQLAGKRLQLLKEAVPEARRVAILVNTANPGARSTLQQLESAARPLGLNLQILEARSVKEMEDAFTAIINAGANSLYVSLDPLFYGQRSRLLDLAADRRLPAMYDLKAFVDAGGLISYGPDFASLFARVAYLIDKVLKGVRPADLPVEQPTKFELVINLKTAQALGLTVPQSLLAQADEVIE